MIQLHFPKLSSLVRKEEVCQIATPHPQGALRDVRTVSVCGANGPVPTQSQATALWPDGSIKWMLTKFLADLPANRGTDEYVLTESPTVLPALPASVEANGGAAVIDTGALKLNLGAPGEPVFGSAEFAGGSFGADELQGPFVSIDGKPYRVLVGPDGWQVLEKGPVAVTVRTMGKHIPAEASEGEGCVDFHLIIRAWAGKPYIELEYRFLHKEDTTDPIMLSDMRLDLKPATEGTNCCIGYSNYKTKFKRSEGEAIDHEIDNDYLLYTANEQMPQVNFGAYFANWQDAERGLCVSVYQAFQNYPKGFHVDRQGLSVGLIPGSFGEIRVEQGMARAQKMLLHFHPAETPELELDFRSLQYNMPDKPAIESCVYTNAGLYREFIGEKRQMNVELFIKNLGESTAYAYGLMHWGDAPDMGYTTQGRAHGEYVWTNNEYDYPHQCMIEYARTGNRAFLDKLLVAASHWQDVDVCHYSKDPLLMGGQHMHSRYHVEIGCKPSHEWVEGLLDYYHLTGDPFTLDTVNGIATNVEYVLTHEIFTLDNYTAAREAGWALRTFCAMYSETGDEVWLRHCDRIVDYFVRWREDYGAWLQPYTDHTMVRVPFMISVACVSLMMYYRIRPSELIKDLIITAMDDVLENCYSYDGVLYYKELPSLQRTGMNPIAMQALTYCYELTGDKTYLEKALVMFRLAVFLKGRGGSTHHGSKTASRDSVVCGGDSPKSFAQSYPCFATLYKALMDNDMLPADFCTSAMW
ncbi:MAG: hypothetical protein IJM90_02295 [Firmicutes bacterium]|nr:hypothetical protein [Bacillota bacterium]